ncbi:hypothetical protein NAC44_11920 [Allorhizobium sp. BGMRC 0089]|uniref:hypothetical protein n=1 Tax=Allorhizobium sonneratiae TaxID=2934936 RepID=UPI00203467FC|nr:hypothetical protein [Allorhizobium sonneratiae]MCM2293029.1 hypothetical protein [Allorhizobium sonneratiae]
MAVYVNQPLVPITYLRPKQALFERVASAVEGGRNLAGQTVSMAITGGGYVRCTYSDCVLERDDTERHEVVEWLAQRGNGSFRFFTVPIINRDIGPFPSINGRKRPVITGIPHSDGSLFSDGSGYSQATVFGKVLSTASVGAGQMSIRLYGAARDLRWSDWFSILHPTKGWRAYAYWEVISKSAQGSEIVGGVDLSYRDYTLAIGPALREAVSAGDYVEFSAPRCVMKFAPDFSLSTGFSGFLSARPTLQFVEAF